MVWKFTEWNHSIRNWIFGKSSRIVRLSLHYREKSVIWLTLMLLLDFITKGYELQFAYWTHSIRNRFLGKSSRFVRSSFRFREKSVIWLTLMLLLNFITQVFVSKFPYWNDSIRNWIVGKSYLFVWDSFHSNEEMQRNSLDLFWHLKFVSIFNIYRHLGFNSLNGTIPSEIGNLRLLQQL